MGKGHGTDKAIVAGLLGLAPDDSRLRNEMEKSECSREEILEEMHSNLIVMRESIERGLDVSEKPHGLFTGGDAIKLMSYAKQSSMGADIEEKNGEMKTDYGFQRRISWVWSLCDYRHTLLPSS